MDALIWGTWGLFLLSWHSFMLFFCCCCCYFFAHVHSFLWCVFLCVWFDVETLSSSSSQSQQPQGICSKLELQELQGQRLQEIIPAPAPLLGTLLHNLINAHVRRLCSEKQEKDEALLDSFSWLKHDITKKNPFWTKAPGSRNSPFPPERSHRLVSKFEGARSFPLPTF